MKKIFTLILIVVSAIANAQVTWDFATAAPTGGIQPNSTVGSISQGNNNGTTTLITAVSPSSNTGASGGNNAGAAARVGVLNTAANGSAYFEVTLTPSTGYFLNITGVNNGSRGTGTGPQLITIRSSVDAFATDLSSVTVLANSAWALSTFSGLNLTGAIDQIITLRFYGSNGTGAPSANTANWRIDDLKITYTSSNVLPVTISTFTGSYTNKTSLLKWSVDNEININKYVVEQSADGRTFSEIGSVNATGSTEYSYTDANAKSGLNFYRLKIVGASETKYSAVVKILSDAFSSKLNTYPSPAVNYVNAEFTSENRDIATVQMTDVSGRIVMLKKMPVTQGYNNLSFDVNTLNKGMYILKVSVGSKTVSSTFNK